MDSRSIKFPTRLKHSTFLSILFLCSVLVACQSNRPVQTTAKPQNLQTSSQDQKAYRDGLELLFSAKDRYEYPKAIELLEQAVQIDPQHANARFALLYALLKRSQYAKADAQIQLLTPHKTKLNPKDRLWLAALTAKVNDQADEEIAAWNKVVAAFPEDRWAWYELSTAYAITRQFGAAASAAETASQLEPDPAKWEASWIYYLLSKMNFRNGEYEAAVAAAKQGQNNKTTWRSTYFRQALAEIKTGAIRNPEDAAAEYRRISIAEGKNNETYTNANTSLFYFEAGDYARSARHAQLAYDIDPGSYQSWTLVFSLTEGGHAKQAIELANDAVNRFPESNYNHAARGWALYRLNRIAEAKVAMDKAVGLSKRRNYHIEHLRDWVNKAASQSGSPQAPPINYIE